MLSHMIATVGAISIILGLSNYIKHIDFNLQIIEMMSYAGVLALIGLPYIESFNDYTDMSDHGKFLMNLLGVIAIPFLEGMTLYLHFEHGFNPDAGAFIGLSSSLCTGIAANIFSSQIMAAISICWFYFGINALILPSLGPRAGMDLLFGLNLVISIILLCVAANLVTIRLNSLDSTTVTYAVQGVQTPIIPFRNVIMLISSTVYHCCLVYYSSRFFAVDHSKGDHDGLFYDDFFATLVFMLTNVLTIMSTYHFYNYTIQNKLPMVRLLIVLFGISYVMAKYIEFPWTNWSLGMILFGGLLYTSSFFF